MRELRGLGLIVLVLAALPACSSDGQDESPALSGVKAISAGFFHSCALLEDGTVSCWGAVHEERPVGASSFRSTTLALTVPSVADARSISAGFTHTCAALSDGRGACWGDVPFTGTPAHEVTDARFVAAGTTHDCALMADATVQCWGESTNLGLGSDPATRRFAGTVPDVSDATAIDVSSYSSCALLADGGVKCWGSTWFDGDTLSDESLAGGVWLMRTPTPRAVERLPSSTAIATGFQFYCAVLADTTVACWGRLPPRDSAPDAAASAYPVAVDGLVDVTAIAAGSDHVCALRSDGTISCWGSNTSGQLGDGSELSSAVPVLVKGIDSAIALSAGNTQTCALLANGTVSCWGDNGCPSCARSSIPQVVRTAP